MCLGYVEIRTCPNVGRVGFARTPPITGTGLGDAIGNILTAWVFGGFDRSTTPAIRTFCSSAIRSGEALIALI
jgi:hypothetical protein